MAVDSVVQVKGQVNEPHEDASRGTSTGNGADARVEGPTDDGADAKELERVREDIGISRTMLLKLLGIDSSQGVRLDIELDDEKRSILLRLHGRYVNWKAELLAKIEARGEFSTHELAMLLDLTDYDLYMLRWRGVLTYTRKMGRNYIFTKADIVRILDGHIGTRNLAGDTITERGRTRKPLALSFMRYLEREGNIDENGAVKFG